MTAWQCVSFGKAAAQSGVSSPSLPPDGFPSIDERRAQLVVDSRLVADLPVPDAELDGGVEGGGGRRRWNGRPVRGVMFDVS
jgi:hypothetical protein